MGEITWLPLRIMYYTLLTIVLAFGACLFIFVEVVTHGY